MPYLFRRRLCLAVLAGVSLSLAAMTTVHAAEPPAGKSQSLTLKIGQPPTATQFDVSIQLIEFKDSRCPTGAQCIWAGHATASLKLIRAGAAAETIIIGTQAPPAMQLPFQAISGDLQFTLTALEPVPSTKSTVSADSIRASILIEKR
jgi:hypothetical protein